MEPREELPGPCGLCGSTTGIRVDGSLACADCGWRYGDAPDYDLPRRRVDVVYYLRAATNVKIGTTQNPRQRFAALRFDEVLAFEPGDRSVEQARHAEFAAFRLSREWFELRGELAEHIERLVAVGEPWTLYARWMSASLRGGGGRD